MEAWVRAKNLLCVCGGGVAEVLLASPALRALRQQVPGRRIAMLASRMGLRAALHVPEIDESIGDAGEERGELAALLQARGFDAAVIFASPGESAWRAAAVCRDAGIALRLAHSGADPEARHEVRRQLDLVALVGARPDDERLSFRVRPGASSRARIKLEEAGVEPKQSFIVVHPGAGVDTQRWPHARLGETCARLSLILDSQIVVVGDAADRAAAEVVRRGAGDRARSLAGSLTLEELAALLELAPLVVTDHPDAIHLSAAVGTPVVDLHSAHDFRRTPWMVANRVLPRAGAMPRDAAGGVALPEDALVDAAVAATCDLWLDIHWRSAA